MRLITIIKQIAARLWQKQKKIRGFQVTKNAPIDTKLPIRGSEGSAGYDAFAPCDIFIPAHGCSELIHLNIKAYMQQGEWLAILCRSSYGVKEEKGHLIVVHGVGVVDSDFYSNPTNDGNIGVMFYSRVDHDVIIPKGDRCCQLIFMPYLLADNDINLGCRKGGYGSSGD